MRGESVGTVWGPFCSPKWGYFLYATIVFIIIFFLWKGKILTIFVWYMLIFFYSKYLLVISDLSKLGIGFYHFEKYENLGGGYPQSKKWRIFLVKCSSCTSNEQWFLMTTTNCNDINISMEKMCSNFQKVFLNEKTVFFYPSWLSEYLGITNLKYSRGVLKTNGKSITDDKNNVFKSFSRHYL